MSMSIDGKKIPRQYDSRIKLDDDDREKIRKLRKQDEKKWSYQVLAEKFGISKKLVIMICRPDIAEKNRRQFKERRKDGRYYDKDKWRLQMRKHRAYKKDLEKDGKLIDG